MVNTRLALALVVAINLMVATSFGQMIIHFEGPANGTPVSVGNLNASISNPLPGLGSWSFDAGNNVPWSVTNVYFYTTNNPFVGNNGLAVSHVDLPSPTNDFKIRLQLGASYPELSGGYYLNQNLSQITDPAIQYTGWDEWLAEDNLGHYRIVQRILYPPGDSYEVHSSHSDSVGPRALAPAGRHWITYYISRASGKFGIQVWDASTRQQLGSNSVMNIDPFNVTQISLSTYGHGYSTFTTNTFDQITVFTNSSMWPYFPWDTNTFYVRTNGSDLHNGWGDNAGGAFQTIGKAITAASSGGIIYVRDGIYDERLSITKSGLTIIGTNAVCRGFDVSSAPNTKILGMEITHNSSTYSRAITLSGNTHDVLIADNYIHNTWGDQCIQGMAGSHNIYNVTIRGNKLTELRWVAGVGTNCYVQAIGCDSGCHNWLVEYNDISRTGDFVNLYGTNHIVRNNWMHDHRWAYCPITDTSQGHSNGHVHSDMCQPGSDGYDASSQNHVYERNFMHDSIESQSHVFLLQDNVHATTGVDTNFLIRGNVAWNIGDGFTGGYGTDGVKLYNNSVMDLCIAINGSVVYFNNSPYSSDPVWVYNMVINNDHTASSNLRVVAPGVLTAVHNHGYLAGSHASYDSTADPQFVNTGIALRDLRLQASSPCRGTGVSPITITSASNTGTSFTVNEPQQLCDGMGMVEGDLVTINGTPTRVVSVNWGNGTVVVADPVSWSTGDQVHWGGNVNEDKGAYPYGATYLNSATLTNNNGTYTATATGDVRGFWFYRDGIPYAWIYKAPYQTNIPSGVVTVKAYANWAQSTPVVTATAGIGGGQPTINTQPQSQTVSVGQSATFSVAATSSSGTLHYGWLFNGSAVGTDSSAYTRVNCQLADNGGSVQVNVTDDNGATLSSVATLTVNSAPGSTFYVSPTLGNDSTGSGLLSAPFASIGKAYSLINSNGTIYLLAGSWHEQVALSSPPITLANYTNSKAIIDGQGTMPASSNSALVSVTTSNCTLRGIQVINSGGLGVNVTGPYVTIDGVTTSNHFANGIIFQSGAHYGKVLNSIVTNNVTRNFSGNHANWDTGISFCRGAFYGLVSNTIVSYNGGEGLSTFNSTGAVFVANISRDNYAANVYVSDARDVAVIGNLIYTSSTNLALWNSANNRNLLIGREVHNPDLDNVLVMNNLIYGGQNNFQMFDSGSDLLTRIKIIGNTFADSIAYNIRIGVTNQNGEFRDNIVSGGSPITFIGTGMQAGFTMGNNDWSSDPGAAFTGTGDIIADPLMSKTGAIAAAWFRPSSSSPVKGSGVTLSSLTNYYDGVVRGTPPDIGALQALTVNTNSGKGMLKLKGGKVNRVIVTGP